jgi:hypothetical protein
VLVTTGHWIMHEFSIRDYSHVENVKYFNCGCVGGSWVSVGALAAAWV